MFALAAAVFFILRAFGVNSDDVDFTFLALGLWSLHFFYAVPFPKGG